MIRHTVLTRAHLKLFMMFLMHILKSIQLKKVSLQEFANLNYIIHVSRGVEISMAGSIVKW